VKSIVGRLIIPSVVWVIGSGLAAQEIVDKFVPVTQKDLNSPAPADWLMLGGNMEHWNYSPLDQINRQNVGGLQLVWARADANHRRPGRNIAAHPQRDHVSD
jgi:glucose dehydrogenase